jgi:uncharacterized membrane protein YfcA
MLDLILVVSASGLAGFVDAIVGGGGLVLIPAMFATYPSAPAATLLGTNKAGAIWGTAWASFQYAQRVSLHWGLLLPALFTALAGAFLGAWAVTTVPALGLRRALPWLLGVVLAYTLWHKQMGRAHSPRWAPRTERALAAAIGASVGFYDGFFGPGTGSFFVFFFVRLLGYDFLNASAAAKLLNSATNAAALALFAWRGNVWWHVAVGLAIANVAGSWLGTRLALRHGAGFVRTVFIVVVAALILKTAVDSARL